MENYPSELLGGSQPASIFRDVGVGARDSTGRGLRMWVSGRGRPRELPYDATPLRGSRVDVRARIAWLLRVTRMASPIGGTGKDFARRLTEAGYPSSEAQVSRVEAGTLSDIPGGLISAYERLLHLPSGHLRGVCEALDHSLGAGRLVPPKEARSALPLDIPRTLAEVDERIGDGHAAGGDWLTLATMLHQPRGLVLPPRLQDEWVGQLMGEMVRSIGGAYISRFDALSRMIRHPLVRGSVVHAVRDLIFDEGAQSRIDAISLLGEVPDPLLVGELVGYLVEHDGVIRRGAAFALLQPVMSGRLTPDQAVDVQRAVLTVAHDDPEHGGDDAFLLAQRMSLSLTRQVVSLLGRNPTVPTPSAHIETPGQLSVYLRAAAGVSGLEQDRMLQRLLQEALSVDFVERRHHALMLLLMSPYRSVLADAAVTVAGGADDPVASTAAGHLLSYLADDGQRPGLVGLLRSSGQGQQAAALMGLAHGGGVSAGVDLHAQLGDPGLERLAVYAAGMSGHPDLASVAGDRFSPEVRAHARWWERQGPGIRESAPSTG